MSSIEMAISLSPVCPGSCRSAAPRSRNRLLRGLQPQPSRPAGEVFSAFVRGERAELVLPGTDEGMRPNLVLVRHI